MTSPASDRGKRGQLPLPRPTSGASAEGDASRTKASSWWLGLVVSAIGLFLLIIFIAQNNRDVTISFFSAEVIMPLGLALLLAAVLSALIVAVPGSIRILQLRRHLRRHQKASLP